MLSTSLSSQQWNSAHYLTGLCHKSVCFALSDQQHLALQDPVNAGSHDLILFAESINLEKLHAVQSLLGNWLQVHYFQAGREMHTGFAIEARVDVLKAEGLSEQLENLAVTQQIDVSLLAQRPKLSEPGLILMDMDSTVIGVECIDEIAKLAGVGEQVSEVTELAMQGKLDFVESLTNRVGCLKGAPETILQQVKDALPINPGISYLLHTLHQKGWKLAIASGGFTFFADYLKDRLNLDFVVANQLEIQDGRLTGNVIGEVVDANRKAQTLLVLAEKFNLPLQQTIALGDGANDLVMMAKAGLGVAYHAKPVVRQQADAALRFCAADGLLAYLAQDQ